MKVSFIEKIQSYPHPLFYNTTGSTIAYKLCIRHLSACVSEGLAYKIGKYLHPYNELHILDVEKETIDIITSKIELKKLEILS